MKPLPILVFTVSMLFLVSCNAQQKEQDWELYQSEQLGISFMHPPEYIPTDVAPEEIVFNQTTIDVLNENLRQADPISPFISVTRTSDPVIKKYLEQNHPLQSKNWNGQEIWYFHLDGMADPQGYLFYSQSHWIVLEFVGFSDRDVIDRVIQSAQLINE